MTSTEFVPVIMLIMGLVNAWLIWLATESKKERLSLEEKLKADGVAMDQKVKAVQVELKDFELKVTQEYARTTDIREIRDQIANGIQRLADRIDRLVEAKTTQKV